MDPEDFEFEFAMDRIIVVDIDPEPPVSKPENVYAEILLLKEYKETLKDGID